MSGLRNYWQNFNDICVTMKRVRSMLEDEQQVRVTEVKEGAMRKQWGERQRVLWRTDEWMKCEGEREKGGGGCSKKSQESVRLKLKQLWREWRIDDILVEIWKFLGEKRLLHSFNHILQSERIPEERRKRVLVLIFKNKGDVQSCTTCTHMKLISLTMKIWVRVEEGFFFFLVFVCFFKIRGLWADLGSCSYTISCRSRDTLT